MSLLAKVASELAKASGIDASSIDARGTETKSLEYAADVRHTGEDAKLLDDRSHRQTLIEVVGKSAFYLLPVNSDTKEVDKVDSAKTDVIDLSMVAADTNDAGSTRPHAFKVAPIIRQADAISTSASSSVGNYEEAFSSDETNFEDVQAEARYQRVALALMSACRGDSILDLEVAYRRASGVGIDAALITRARERLRQLKAKDDLEAALRANQQSPAERLEQALLRAAACNVGEVSMAAARLELQRCNAEQQLLDALQISDSRLLESACKLAEAAGVDHPTLVYAQLEAQRLCMQEAQGTPKGLTIYQRLRRLEEQGRLKVDGEVAILMPQRSPALPSKSFKALPSARPGSFSKSPAASQKTPKAFIEGWAPAQSLAEEPRTPHVVCKLHGSGVPSRSATTCTTPLQSSKSGPEPAFASLLANRPHRQPPLCIDTKLAMAPHVLPEKTPVARRLGQGWPVGTVPSGGQPSQSSWMNWLPGMDCAVRDKNGATPGSATGTGDSEKEPNYL